MNAASARSGALTGRKVFAMFALFFGTIALADTVLVVTAVRSWSGAEAASAYKAGQLYNGEIAQARRQAARGWNLRAETQRRGDGAAVISVKAEDAKGQPLAGRRIVATLQRPTDRRSDRASVLVEETPGSFGTAISDVSPGQWDLVLDVMEGDERSFRRKSRIILR